MPNIALMGPKFMVGPLSIAEVDIFPCDSTLQSRETLAKISSRKEHSTIFMIERYSTELKEDIEATEKKGINILLLPDHRGSIGLFREMLHGLIRKATGASQI